MKEEEIPIEALEPVVTGPGRASQILRQVLGYGIAVVCLVWVFYDIHPERLLSQLGNINWAWIFAGLICDFLSYLAQGYRWRLLLKPEGNITTPKTTQAIYCGLFTNEVLPFRTGELVRAYLVSRWMGTTFVGVIPSIMVERFFDAIWLGVGVGLTALLVELPKNLVRAADILGVIVLAFIAIFILLVIRREKQLERDKPLKPPRWKILGILGATLNRLASGIKSIHTAPSFYLAFLISPLFLIFQILALWLIMIGYGLNISIWAGAAIMMILMLGIAIPNAPSNVGTYQFFTVVGLTLFDVDKTTASGFSVVAFIVLTLPLWILGAIALTRTGMKLKDIQNEISKLVKRGI